MRLGCLAVSFGLVCTLACGGYTNSEPESIPADPFTPAPPVEAPARSAPTPLDDDILVTGTRGAPISVIQYSDWRCSHCEVAYPNVLAAVEAEPSAALYFRSFPLSDDCGPGTTDDRCTLAAAALCAAEDGTFTSFAPAAFSDPAGVVREASSGPRSAWTTCVADAATMERVARHKAAGTADGVRGTPTLFVGTGGEWAQVLPGDLQTYLHALVHGGPVEVTP